MSRPAQPRTRTELAAADRVRRLRRSLAADIRNARGDAGLSSRRLAAAAGVSASTLREIEVGRSEPSLSVLARVGEALGMDLSVRLYPGTGPLIRDHIQAAMIETLLDGLHRQWHPHPEVWVAKPVRGVIDLVLEPDSQAEPFVAVEAQSELRRLEQQVRWAHAKADALEAARERRTSRLLLLRNTRRTRTVVAEHAHTVAAAYPASAASAVGALTTEAPWAGAAIVWVDVRRGQARLRAAPPRGIAVGR